MKARKSSENLGKKTGLQMEFDQVIENNRILLLKNWFHHRNFFLSQKSIIIIIKGFSRSWSLLVFDVFFGKSFSCCIRKNILIKPIHSSYLLQGGGLYFVPPNSFYVNSAFVWITPPVCQHRSGEGFFVSSINVHNCAKQPFVWTHIIVLSCPQLFLENFPENCSIIFPPKYMYVTLPSTIFLKN